MSSKILIPCPECGGGGKIPLPDHLQETFAFVKAQKTCTAESLAFHVSNQGGAITPAGAANRLSDLFNMGLLARTKKSKTYFYSLAK